LARDPDIEGKGGKPTQALKIQNHCNRMEKQQSRTPQIGNPTKAKEKDVPGLASGATTG
jgi:hypothetical protein